MRNADTHISSPTDTEQPLLMRPAVADFVTVAAELCKHLETPVGANDAARWSDVMRPLLAMLYVRASLLPAVEEMPGYNEEKVTEDDYEFVRCRIAALLGTNDEFLDVFVEDFKYSDAPVFCTISENLADIYQTLRNFVEVVRGGHEEALQVALYDIEEQFALSWGQKLLGALRALHENRYDTL